MAYTMTSEPGSPSNKAMEVASSSPPALPVTATAVHATSGGDIMSSAASQSTSPDREIFTTIPPEIRNRIYELGMPAPDPETEVDLLTAEPPSKALLLTCRQVYGELKLMYRHAYRKFWSETKFVLGVEGIENRPTLQNALESFMDKTSDEDVAVMTALRIHQDIGVHWTLVEDTWHAPDLDGTRVREIAMVPPAKEGPILAAGFRTFHWSDPVSGVRVTVKQLDPARKNELFRMAGRDGLTKGEIIAMIEEMTGWMMEGHHTWTRD